MSSSLKFKKIYIRMPEATDVFVNVRLKIAVSSWLSAKTHCQRKLKRSP